MMPELDKEVALKIVSQLPEFTKLARAALEDAADAFGSVLNSNECSQARLHEIHLEALRMVKSELGKALTPDERLRVLDIIREIHQASAARDADNKEFLDAQFTKRLALVGGVIVAVLVFVGARMQIQKDGTERQPEYLPATA